MGHVELFTCDDLPAFIAKSRAQAEKLPESDKSLILIERGAQLVSQKPDGSLSLTDLPPADLTNTVHFPRLLPLCSVKTDNQVTSDGQNNEWVQITAGNAQGLPISGWVNISKDSHGNFPPHIKRVSPWEWTDFNPLEETVNVANMVEKSRDNRRMTLNLADYTESMTALHHILTQTPLNKAAESAAELPSFTDKQLKAGLRTPWTAEQIGRLLVKYESEWYADESLSKWHEIDSLYQNQYDQKKQSIADELTQANITKPAERDYAMQILDKSYQQQTDEWQIEKQQRIKPSLWWREVAEGQAAITPAPASTSAEAAESPETTPQPVLSNLCATGKVWHLHPVGMGVFVIPQDLLLTMEMLLAAHPNGSKEYYNQILPYLNEYALVYKLTEAKEIAHFLSQIGHESGFKIVEENLSYNAKRMKLKFGCKRGEKHYNEATDSCALGQLRPKLWTDTAYYEKKPEHLGNYIYANRMGNGDESSGDGYRYRGRGVIQLTGKEAYQNFTNIHNRNNPDDKQDFVANPDLLVSAVQYGIESAFVYWFTKTGKPDPAINKFVKLQDLARSGTVKAVTQLVNGGQNGYADRKQRFNRLAKLTGLKEEE